MDEEKNDIPMIPKHMHEKQMMHMSWTVRWLVVAVVIGFLCMVGMAYIFVNGYTSRTKDWLNTFNNMQKRVAVTEVANEEEKAGIIQQSPIP